MILAAAAHRGDSTTVGVFGAIVLVADVMPADSSRRQGRGQRGRGRETADQATLVFASVDTYGR